MLFLIDTSLLSEFSEVFLGNGNFELFMCSALAARVRNKDTYNMVCTCCFLLIHFYQSSVRFSLEMEILTYSCTSALPARVGKRGLCWHSLHSLFSHLNDAGKEIPSPIYFVSIPIGREYIILIQCITSSSWKQGHRWQCL